MHIIAYIDIFFFVENSENRNIILDVLNSQINKYVSRNRFVLLSIETGVRKIPKSRFTDIRRDILRL